MFESKGHHHCCRTLGKKARNEYGYQKDGSREMEKPGDWAAYCPCSGCHRTDGTLLLSHGVEIRGYEDRYPQISSRTDLHSS